ncbi:MAG: lamin tail domain-containing protein, partial [Sedimentisphaerales bacterium]|nr:lamin tail domain-containing protein [Sedimentisphaerales bacterium]
GPTGLHRRLTDNTEYRMLFADHIHRHFFNDGVLTPEGATDLYQIRLDDVDRAVVGESARWGDNHRSTPYTRNAEWITERDWLLSEYFQQRTDIVLNQFKSRGWYPDVEAPTFYINGAYKHGGLISTHDTLYMEASEGTIWYTLDGTDPRQVATSSGDDTSTTLVAENADKRVLVPTSNIGTSWKSGNYYNDSSWIECTSSPGGVGYEHSSGYQDYLSLDLEELMYGRTASCYIRVPFTFDGNPDDFNFMTLNVRYDDGFVAYLNGTEVASRNFNGTPTWNSRASTTHSDSLAVDFEVINISDFLSLLQRGNNLLAIQGMNSSTTSSDLLISAKLIAGRGAAGDSGISSSAIRYTSPIALDHSAAVKARVLSGNTWSALNETIFAVGAVAENFRITEIMYHPQALTDAGEPNEEFIELTNIGTETINLNLVRFTNGIDFTFPSLDLAPGEYIVVVQDREIFEARYGTEIPIAGQYTGRLNNAGERIVLEDALGQTILDFDFIDAWRSLTDGEGFSLTIIDPANPDLNSWNEKESWRASAYIGGSPGLDDSGLLPNPGDVVINELLANSSSGEPDWIELYNTTGTAIDLGGWFLSDNNANLFKYEIASGTIIAPNGYLVFFEDVHFGNTNDAGCHEPFALSNNGERVILSSTENDILTGYREVEDFGASATDVSFGRYVKSSTGNTNFVAMESPTPGSENAYPLVGSIVISEIMYNPDWPAGGAYTNDQYEYIELHNISAEPVTLYDADKDVSWAFTDGIDFIFPVDAPVTIPAGSCVLVVKYPEAFMWRYPDVPIEKIFGPYEGSLSNAGESLELSMPGDDSYIRIDRVNYSDGSHPEDCPGSVDLWPTEPDGAGLSLRRRILTDYGNDPENWIADVPSPGS